MEGGSNRSGSVFELVDRRAQVGVEWDSQTLSDARRVIITVDQHDIRATEVK
jgi:hypothetical protein